MKQTQLQNKNPPLGGFFYEKTVKKNEKIPAKK
jgi:hypothetical protein